MLAGLRGHIELPSFDYAELESRVLALDAACPIDAVLCLVDTRLHEAARLACRLGLRHLNPASAALLRDKFEVRRALAARGLTQPAFALATSNAALRAAVEQLGLPLLIKPADGFGSQNIVLLRYPEDLDPLLSPLDDMLPSGVDYGLGARASDRLLVERHMAGRVIGCDSLTENGRHRLLGVHEKEFFAPPSFAIRGGCFTPNRGQFAAIEAYLFATLDALGFDWGAAHTEIMLTADGLRLIEVNPRLVGARIARLVGYALARSLHADLIALHAGEPAPPAPPAPVGVAVTRWIVASQAGTLAGVDLPPQDDTRIRRVELLKRAGDAVGPPFDNADRIGYVMVCAALRDEAERLADDFVARCDCRFQAGPG
jgi:biotin carboxylase